MNEKFTSDDVADALLNLCANEKLCDKNTEKGFKTSKKKDILKSKKRKLIQQIYPRNYNKTKQKKLTGAHNSP